MMVLFAILAYVFAIAATIYIVVNCQIHLATRDFHYTSCIDRDMKIDSGNNPTIIEVRHILVGLPWWTLCKVTFTIGHKRYSIHTPGECPYCIYREKKGGWGGNVNG